MGKLPQKSAETQHRFARVVDALAATIGVDPNRASALEGRLKNFMRLGLPGLKTGKGVYAQYSREHADQWLIALLLTIAGGDPAVVVKAIKDHWEKPGALAMGKWAKNAVDAESATNPVFLTMRPQHLAAAWARPGSRELDALRIGFFRRYDFKLKDEKGRPIQRENVALHMEWAADDDDWLAVRNLTNPLQLLHRHLDIDTEGTDQ
jgi:hypothetical protein